MNTKQKALVVRLDSNGSHGLDELNVQLERGWRVVEVAPMGGAGAGAGAEEAPHLCLAALVIVEQRDDEDASEVVAQAEEETEELVEELVGGEGLSEEQLSEELGEERNGGNA